MANKRMISGVMWEDEFFTGLSIFERLLWVGLITNAADDQGRIQDSAALIRSKIFPLDDISLADIERSLELFCKARKIDRYTAGGKKCIQIVAWWKHQTPRWAGHSNLPAPDNWVDRERYHGSENKLITKNWDSIGGYIASYTTNDIKDDVNDDDNIKDDDEIDPASDFAGPFQIVKRVIERQTGVPGDGATAVKAIDAIVDMNATEQDIINGIAWLIGEGKTIHSYSQIVGPTRTAMQKRIQSNGNGKSSPPKYAETY